MSPSQEKPSTLQSTEQPGRWSLRGLGFNPFYGALLVVGVVFALTAICYGIMALRELRGMVAAEDQGGLMAWMAQHGQWLLGVELAALMLFSLAAMLTDEFWHARSSSGSAKPDSSVHSSSQADSQQQTSAASAVESSQSLSGEKP